MERGPVAMVSLRMKDIEEGKTALVSNCCLSWCAVNIDNQSIIVK